MSRKLLLHRIFSLQNQVVWELNDVHIFVRQALPLLNEAKATHGASKRKGDRRYFVPSINRTKFARRTDRELKSIYESFTTRRLYEAFLVTAIGEFEGFLGKVLREVFRDYPLKLGQSCPGITACRGPAIDTLLSASTLEALLERTVDDHLRGVFFASPKAYLEYFSKIVGTEFDAPTVAAYFEMKATRDILVHTDRVANVIYEEKAGALARVTAGHLLVVDSDYFDRCLATLKRLSGIVKRDAVKTFPARNVPADGEEEGSGSVWP